MEEIRYLTEEEKQRTRSLWEEVFWEDGESFLDYYYSVKTRDNEILVLEREGQILSMLQLNPYRLRIGAQEADTAYVIAVATRESCRHQGMMRRLLVKAMRDRREQGQPLLWLMPADEAIYHPFGFRFIYEQQRGRLKRLPGEEDSFSSEKRGDGLLWEDICMEPLPEGEEERAAAFAEGLLEETAQVYAVRDEAYYRTLRAESAAEDGGLMKIVYRGELAGLFSYTRSEGGLEIREPLIRRDCRGCTGELLLDCLKGEDIEAKVFGLWPETAGSRRTEKVPAIMARILNLPVFLAGFRADEEMELIMEVRDEFLDENNGIFRWKIGPEESRLSRAGKAVKPEAELTVEGLTELLFGRKTPEEAVERAAAEGIRKLERIRKLTRVFLNEVV